MLDLGTKHVPMSTYRFSSRSNLDNWYFISEESLPEFMVAEVNLSLSSSAVSCFQISSSDGPVHYKIEGKNISEGLTYQMRG